MSCAARILTKLIVPGQLGRVLSGSESGSHPHSTDRGSRIQNEFGAELEFIVFYFFIFLGGGKRVETVRKARDNSETHGRYQK